MYSLRFKRWRWWVLLTLALVDTGTPISITGLLLLLVLLVPGVRDWAVSLVVDTTIRGPSMRERRGQ